MVLFRGEDVEGVRDIALLQQKTESGARRNRIASSLADLDVQHLLVGVAAQGVVLDAILAVVRTATFTANVRADTASKIAIGALLDL